MSTVFSRTMSFRTDNLGADATLMLTFDKRIEGMYNDKFPVCWKVTKFGRTGPYHIDVTYTSQIAFSKPQFDHASDTIVDAGTFVAINTGQKTTLTKDDNGIYKFSGAEADTGSTLKAYNGCPLREDMAIGFLNRNDFTPSAVLYFKEVGQGSFVQADFTPVLHAYVTTQYQETQIIRGEVNTPILWEQNLATLEGNTVWDVKYDASTGKFSITKAQC